MGKVTVMGSFIYDVTAYVPRYPVDGETVLGYEIKTGPGGKGANQATSAAKCGAETTMIVKTGKDDFANALHENFRKVGISEKYVYESETEGTGAAVILVHRERGENRIAIGLGANATMSVEEVARAEEEIAQSDILLTQFETNAAAIQEFVRLGRKYNKPIMMNPAPFCEMPENIFEGVDYLGTPEALDEFFTEEACRALGDHSRSIGLEPNVFVFQDASWNDACSEKREDSVRHFEKAAQAAKWIGCRIVSTLVPMPCGATPWKFNPAAPAIKQGYHMPADYCYQKDWDTLMDSYRKCLAIAKRYGLRMSVECFPYSMISTPHAMLQLLKDVDDPDFGIQLDTNHLIMQHIDPEWTIYMLGGKRIFNVHCKDSDAVSRNNIPAGCGITDYPAVIQALKNVGYDGNLSVELEFTDNPRRYNKQAMDHLKLCLAGEY